MKKTFILISMLSILITLPLLTACSPEEKEESGKSTNFEQIPHTTNTTAKDFKISDIDALIEMSLKMEGLRLQYAKMMSDGWQGELYGGAGRHTSGTKFYTYVTELLENADQYQNALKRLENDGILTKPTVTRGIFLDFAGWCYALNDVQKKSHERMTTILNNLKVTGNQQAMQQLFDQLPQRFRNGESNARQWFINFYNGDYINQSSAINETWLTAGEGEGTGHVAAYFDKYADLYDNGAGNPRWKDAHEVTKEVAEKGGTFYVSCVDEVTGGYVGKWIDINDISEETITLAKKIKEGKATTADLKRFATQLGSKYVKEKAGDLIGDDPGGLERLAGEITDFATTHAMEQADEEIAKGLGLNLYEIQKNTTTGVIVTIIEDVKEGNITIGFPDKNGTTHVVTKPGEKNITVITNGGERTTQHIDQQKPGKVVVEAQPQPTQATINFSPEKVEAVATGGKVTVDILTNCPYARFKNYDAEWLQVSRNGKTLSLNLEENTDDKPRTVKLKVEVSFDGKNVDATGTLTITQAAHNGQEDNPQIEVTPSALNFDAKGGEQTISIDAKTYDYYGGFTDDDCESWVTVTITDNQTLIVKVSANNTGTERIGTIYAFGTNNPEPKSIDEVSLQAITVTQAAGNMQSALQLYKGKINVNVCVGIWTPSIWEKMGSIEFQVTDNFATITSNGNTMHFDIEKVEEEKESDGTIYERARIKASFELINLHLLESKQAQIRNLRYEKSIERTNHYHGAWGRYAKILRQTDEIKFSLKGNFPEENNKWSYAQSYQEWDWDAEWSAWNKDIDAETYWKRVTYLKGDNGEEEVQTEEKTQIESSITNVVAVTLCYIDNSKSNVSIRKIPNLERISSGSIAKTQKNLY